MDIISGSFYMVKNKSYRSEEISFKFDYQEYQFYEVIRIIKGIPLFIADHLNRLKFSLDKTGMARLYNKEEALNIILKLIIANNGQEGNIKLLCRVGHQKLEFAAYYIPHHYPSDKQYKEGISMISFHIERKDPQMKKIDVNDSVRETINTGNRHHAYEILLINYKGFITEGSRSNFFLIKDGNLFSAPKKLILEGITRKHILKICHQLSIKNIYENISLSEIQNFDSAFICGTSPKVLGVRKIDHVNFNVENNVIDIIRDAYDKQINKYVQYAQRADRYKL